MGSHHLRLQPTHSSWTYAPMGLVGEEGHTANRTQPGLGAHWSKEVGGPRSAGPVRRQGSTGSPGEVFQ